VAPEAITDAPRLLAELRSREPSAFSGVPTLWKSLLDAVEAEPSLGSEHGITHALLGGELLDLDTVARTRRLLPNTTVWDIYGPTETTPNAAAGRLLDDGLVPIGRPIANARLYILDRYGQPVLPGHPGELFIGGAGVGRGYWHRPDLTADRFVPDPFSTEPGQRLYRTGDRCRHLADGRIVFLGRVDYQVKLRGYRIELGEIEHALSQCAGVREAVALLLDEPPLEKRLVAYVVFTGARPPEKQYLLDSLHKSLPAYMVPAQWVFLTELPRLPSGKVDRQALPRPELGESTVTTFSPPSTSTEILVAGIWRELLHLERVDVNDSFFDLGGHSLLATQVTARLRHALGVVVPLRTLFECPTLASLAQAVDQMLPKGSSELKSD
jgi:acyl-coenzyme A synthetase/AMP-(fatty) acid ligase/acyl carrier protein